MSADNLDLKAMSSDEEIEHESGINIQPSSNSGLHGRIARMREQITEEDDFLSPIGSPTEISVMGGRDKFMELKKKLEDDQAKSRLATTNSMPMLPRPSQSDVDSLLDSLGMGRDTSFQSFNRSAVASNRIESHPKFLELYQQIKDRDHKILTLETKMMECDRVVIELNDTVKQKEKMIGSKNEAANVIQSKYLKELDAKDEELKVTQKTLFEIQRNFSSAQEAWKNEKSRINTELSQQSEKLRLLEAARFDLVTKTAELQEELVFMVTQKEDIVKETEYRHTQELDEKERQIQELTHTVEKSKSLMQKLKSQFQSKLKALKEKEKENDEAALQVQIVSLGNRVAELEEEKGNLLLHLVDFDEQQAAQKELLVEVETLRNSNAEFLKENSNLKEALHLLENDKTKAAEEFAELSDRSKSIESELEKLQRSSGEEQVALQMQLAASEELEDAYSQEKLSLLKEIDNLKSKSVDNVPVVEKVDQTTDTEDLVDVDSQVVKPSAMMISTGSEESTVEEETFVRVKSQDLSVDQQSDISKENDSLKAKVSALTEDISSLNEELVHTIEGYQFMSSEYNSIQLRLSELEKELKDNRTELLNYKKILPEREQQIAQMTEEFERLQPLVASRFEMEQELLSLRSTLSLGSNQMVEQSMREQMLAAEVQTLQESQILKDEAYKQLAAKQASLRSELEVLQTSAIAEGATDNTMAEIQRLRESMSLKETDIQSLTVKCEKLEDKLRKALVTLKQKNSQISMFKTQELMAQNAALSDKTEDKKCKLQHIEPEELAMQADKVASLMIQLQDIQSQNFQMSTVIESLTVKNQEISNDNTNLLETLSETKEARDSCSQKLKETEEELQRQNTLLTSQIESLGTQANSLTNEVASLQEEIQRLRQMNAASLDSESKFADQLSAALKSESLKWENELLEAQTRAREMTDFINQLQERIKDLLELNMNFASVKQERDEYFSRLENLQAGFQNDAIMWSCQVEEAQKQLANMSAELANATLRSENLTTEYDTLVAANVSIKEERDNVMRQLKECQEKLESETKALKKKVEDTEKQNNEYSEELFTLHERLQDLSSDNSSLWAANSSIKDEGDKHIRKLIEEHDQLLALLNEKNENITELMNSCNELKLLFEKKAEELNACAARKEEEIQRAVQQYDEQTKQAHEQLMSLQSDNVAKDELRNNLIIQHKNEIISYSEQIESLAADLRTKDETILQKMGEVNLYVQEINQLKELIGNHKKELQSKQNSIEEINESMVDLRGKVAEYETTLMGNYHLIMARDEEVNYLRSELETYEAKILSNDNRIMIIQEEADTAISKNKEATDTILKMQLDLSAKDALQDLVQKENKAYAEKCAATEAQILELEQQIRSRDEILTQQKGEIANYINQMQESFAQITNLREELMSQHNKEIATHIHETAMTQQNVSQLNTTGAAAAQPFGLEVEQYRDIDLTEDTKRGEEDARIYELEVQVAELQINLDETNIQLTKSLEWKVNFDVISHENEQLMEEIASLKDEITRLKSEKERNIQRLLDMEAISGPKSVPSTPSTSAEMVVEDIIRATAYVTTQAAASSTEEEAKQREIDQQKQLNEIRELKIRNGKMMQKFKQLKDKYESIAKENESLKTKKEFSLESALEDELLGQVKKYETTVEEKSKVITELQSEKDKLLQKVDIMEQANDKLTEVKDYQDKILDDLSQQKRHLEQEIAGLKWRLEEVESIASVANSNNDGSFEPVPELSVSDDAVINSLRQQNSALVQELQFVQQENQEYKGQINQLSHRIQILTPEIQAFQTRGDGDGESSTPVTSQVPIFEQQSSQMFTNVNLATPQNAGDIAPLLTSGSADISLLQQQLESERAENVILERKIELLQEKISEIEGSEMKCYEENISLKTHARRLEMDNLNHLQRWEELRHNEGGMGSSMKEKALHGEVIRLVEALQSRDQRCEELTIEITRLLEERDGLQLKLSNVLKHNVNLYEEFNRGQETPQGDVPSFDKEALRMKLAELEQINYNINMDLRREKKARYLMQEQLFFSQASRVLIRGSGIVPSTPTSPSSSNFPRPETPTRNSPVVSSAHSSPHASLSETVGNVSSHSVEQYPSSSIQSGENAPPSPSSVKHI